MKTITEELRNGMAAIPKTIIFVVPYVINRANNPALVADDEELL